MLPAVREHAHSAPRGVIKVLADVILCKAVPEHMRSDHGPDFEARELRRWLAGISTSPIYIEPGSPWEYGYCESFNSKVQDDFLKGRPSTQ